MFSFWLNRKCRRTGIRYALSAFVLSPARAQWILKPPENITVCLGETATFTATTMNSFAGWKVNDTFTEDLPPEIIDFLGSKLIIGDGFRILLLTVTPPPSDPARFSGSKVQLLAIHINGTATSTEPVYLAYQTYQQNSVTNLMAAISQTAIRVDWQPLNPLLTTRYLLSINNITDPEAPVAVPCDDCWNFSSSHYDFYPQTNGTCDLYEFRVTADECPEADHPVNQSLFSTIIVAYSGIAPVTARLADQEVLINWTPLENSSYSIAITHPGNGTWLYEADYNGTLPYRYPYTPEPCDNFDLNIAVTPDSCNASIHEASVHIFAGCQTISTLPSVTVTIPLVTATPPSVTARPASAKGNRDYRPASSYMSGYRVPVIVVSGTLTLLTILGLGATRIISWKSGQGATGQP